MRSSRSARSWVWPIDIALSATLTVAFLTELVARGDPALIDFVAGPLLASTVAWRRWSPHGAAAVGLVAGVVLHDSEPLAQTLLTPLVAILDFYMLGRGSRARWLAADIVLVLVPIPAIWLTPGDAQPIALVSVWLFFFALPYLTGRAILAQSGAAQELEAGGCAGRDPPAQRRRPRDRGRAHPDRSGPARRGRTPRERHGHPSSGCPLNGAQRPGDGPPGVDHGGGLWPGDPGRDAQVGGGASSQ